MSFGGYFGHILSLEIIKSTYLLYNMVRIIYAPWVYTERRQSAVVHLPGWEWKRLNGCVFSPSFLLPVPGRPKKARKRNHSIASITVCLCCPQFSTGVLHHFYGRYIYFSYLMKNNREQVRSSGIKLLG